MLKTTHGATLMPSEDPDQGPSATPSRSSTSAPVSATTSGSTTPGQLSRDQMVRHFRMELQKGAPSAKVIQGLHESAAQTRTIDNHWTVCQECRLPPALASQRTMKEQGLEQRFPHTDRKKVSHLGAWICCVECAAALHFKCLAKHRQASILDEINVEEAEKSPNGPPPAPISNLTTEKVREDIPCATCYQEPALCYLCGLDPVGRTCKEADEMWGQESDDDITELDGYARPVFRCRRCTRPAHYECLAMAYEGRAGSEHAASFRAQLLDEWKCPDCVAWPAVERVLAWRRLPPDQAEKVRNMNFGRDAKQLDNLTREFLVKFRYESWRKVAWVPYAWLLRVATNELRQFRVQGTFSPDKPLDMTPITQWTKGQYKAKYKFDSWELLDHNPTQPWVQHPAPAPAAIERECWAPHQALAESYAWKIEEQPNAEKLIPASWLEPERVLDVFFRPSVLALDPLEVQDAVQRTERQLRLLRERPIGLPPGSVAGLIHISCLYASPGLWPPSSDVTVSHIAWVLVKWAGLEYDEASWTQVQPEDLTDTSYALRLLDAYTRHTTALWKPSPPSQSQPETYPSRQNPSESLSKDQARTLAKMVDCWKTSRSFILAGNPGAGKTAHVISMIGGLAATGNTAPFLLLVPPQTIAHWTRLLRARLPLLNTVTYSGNLLACNIVETYELHPRSSPELKDSLDFSTFKANVVVADITDQGIVSALGGIACVPRWALVVIDQLAACNVSPPLDLSSINSECRILLSDSQALPMSADVLTNLSNALGPLSERERSQRDRSVASFLKPRILSCASSDVPASVTRVVVPTALTPIQELLYSAVTRAHSEVISGPNLPNDEATNKAAVRNYSIILLDLLRVCQNAFFCGSKKLNPAHKPNPSCAELLSGSGKLALLRKLLRCLCDSDSNHRTVVVSSFTMDLDVIEELVLVQGCDYVRVDRDSSPRDIELVQQAWNEERATCPLALLHARTGSVLNLLAADTVIFFGQDPIPGVESYNLGHVKRFGQTKPLLVLYLVACDTADSKLMDAKLKGEATRGRELVSSLPIYAPFKPEVLKSAAAHRYTKVPFDARSGMSWSRQEVKELLSLRGASEVPTNLGRKRVTLAPSPSRRQTR